MHNANELCRWCATIKQLMDEAIRRPPHLVILDTPKSECPKCQARPRTTHTLPVTQVTPGQVLIASLDDAVRELEVFTVSAPFREYGRMTVNVHGRLLTGPHSGILGMFTFTPDQYVTVRD